MMFDASRLNAFARITLGLMRTNNLKKACSLLEVNLIDHLIISKEECYSFADEASFKIKK